MARRSAGTALMLALLGGLASACSSGQSRNPSTVEDAGSGGTESAVAGKAGAGRAGSGGGVAGSGGARGVAGASGSAGTSGIASTGGTGGTAAAGSAGGNAGASGGLGGAAGIAGAAGVAGTGNASGSGGAAGAASGRCGDIQPASHPPFEAIRKLATSQDEVRILVYGQSISEQAWWSKTKAWLETTYPNANLVMEEHARGGCSSQCLIGHAPWALDGSQYNRLPEDVFAWKPDLIVFHVYGDHVDYGYIMDAFAEGCDAFENYRTFDDKQVAQVRCTDAQRALAQGYERPEVLVQSDFVIDDVPVDCPADPTPADWDCFMNESVIPDQVESHGFALQDNFHDWPAYIAANDLVPATLIQSDMTHLSEPAGTDVMFQLTIPHLCYAP